MKPKIAYVMSRFPHLPETFILREMIELERQGQQVALYPLILQRQPLVHEEAQAWLPRARYIPFLSSQVVASNGRELRRAPYRYGALWARVVRENITNPSFLSRAIVLLPKAVQAAWLMQQEGVGHIHAHYATHPALFAWLIHRLTGLSYSITVHAHDIFVRTEMLATKLREAAFIVAISEYNREYLAQLVGPWVRAKTHIIHCGIVPGQYQAQPRPTEKTCFEIISVGSLQAYKGQRYLVKACGHLRDRGLPFRCRLVGEGEERAALEQMIKRLNLQSRVELLGAKTQAEVARLLATADCYVQPSVITPSGKMEGIPVALMEALACGLPVVASRLSGIPELVRPGETGELVPPADAAALATAIAQLYADPVRASQMAQAGRTLVLKEFELKRNVKRLAALFDQLNARLLPVPEVTMRLAEG